MSLTTKQLWVKMNISTVDADYKKQLEFQNNFKFNRLMLLMSTYNKYLVRLITLVYHERK